MEEHPTKPPEEHQKPFEDFSCGWYKDRLLLPGRLFIARTHVTFQPQFGSQQAVTINISEITGLYKKNTAFLPKHKRDQAFTTLQNLLPNAHASEHDTSEENDDLFSHPLDASDFLEDEVEKSRSRSNSDDEDMLAATKAAGQKAFAAVKRSMTKSASERVIPTTPERSGTPPPPSSVSPHPSFSTSPHPFSNPANISPSVSPAPRRRDDIPMVELSHEREHEIAGEMIPAYAADSSTDNTPREHATDALSDSSDAIAHTQESYDISMVAPPSPEHQPPISPLHSPLIEATEHYGEDAQPHAHAHEHEHEVSQEAAEHPIITTQEIAVADVPALNIGSSTSAPPSPLPNGTPIKKQPELADKIKLPPIVENCDHMVYPPYSDTFPTFMEETLPCPIQDFYRVVLATNFWSEVNDSCGYTDATVTPWLTRNNNAGPCCLYRQINFKMDLTTKIGPKSTRVQQTQRCRLKNSKELILETSSVSADVPYADSFTTDNLLIIKSTKEGTACNLRIACRVNFIKTTWGFGGIIEKSALQGSKDFFAAWIIAVRQRIEKDYTKSRTVSTMFLLSTSWPVCHCFLSLHAFLMENSDRPNWKQRPTSVEESTKLHSDTTSNLPQNEKHEKGVKNSRQGSSDGDEREAKMPRRK